MIPLITHIPPIDPTAVVQRIQASILAYTPLEPEIDDFITLMGGGTRWDTMNDPPSVFTPGWFMWSQEDTVYFHMGGTDIAASYGGHLAIDVGGGFISPVGFEAPWNFHTFWLDNARHVSGILLNFFRRFAPGRFAHLSLSGHSYGGAVAQIAGLLFKRERPDIFVECLAFGSPKPILQANNGVRLDGAHCIQLDDDPVGFVPFTIGAAIWARPGTGIRFLQGEPRIKWQQLGRTYRMRPGSYDELPRTDWHWGAPAVNASMSAHAGSNYRHKCLEIRRAMLGLDEIDAFERSILGSPNPPAPIDPLGPPARRVRINVAGWNEEYFDSPDGSSPLTNDTIDDTITVSVITSMTQEAFRSNIVPLNLANPVYKFTYSISDSIYGNSFSLCLSSPGVLSRPQLEAAGMRLMAKLGKLLSNGGAAQPTGPIAGTAMIMAYRVTQVGRKQNTMLKTGPFLGNYAPVVWATQDGSQQFNSGLNVRMPSLYHASASGPFLDRDVKETTNVWIPSPPDGVVNKDVYVFDGNTSGGSAYGSFLFDFISWLATNPRDSWGHMGVDPNTPQVNLLNARIPAVPAPQQWQFDCSADSLWNPRDIIQIKTANAPKWNGQYRVLSVSHAAPFTVSVAGGPSLLLPGFTSALGIQLRTALGALNQVFFKYTQPDGFSFDWTKPSAHKPARPFSLVSFRRRVTKQKTSR